MCLVFPIVYVASKQHNVLRIRLTLLGRRSITVAILSRKCVSYSKVRSFVFSFFDIAVKQWKQIKREIIMEIFVYGVVINK